MAIIYSTRVNAQLNNCTRIQESEKNTRVYYA